MKVIEPGDPTFKSVVEAVGDDRKPLSGADDEQETAKISNGEGNRITPVSRTQAARAIFGSSARQVKPAIKSFVARIDIIGLTHL